MSQVSSNQKLIQGPKPQRWPGITRSSNQMQVFGKFKRHKKQVKGTIIEEIPSTSSNTFSCDSEVKSFCQNRESILSSQQMIQETIHCIVMPYWIIDREKVKQPVLLKLAKVSFIENELVLPFSLYSSNTRNCFQFKVGNIDFHGKILAIGDNSEELKNTFRRNMSVNPDWKGLPKMVRMNYQVSKLIHAPLGDKNLQPPYKVLTHSEARNLFGGDSGNKFDQTEQSNESSLPTKVNTETSKSKRSQDSIDQRSFREDGDIEDDSCANQQDDGSYSQKKSKTAHVQATKIVSTNKQKSWENEKVEVDKSRMDGSMDIINSKVNEIIHKKSIISNSETNGQVLIAIIDILDYLREFLDLRIQNQNENANSVPEKDSTYKISQKNQIFVEGLIQLDLDLYEAATKHAKANNPASFAYSLVKFSFPRTYIQDVVLGKKFYEKDEFDEFLQSVEGENRKYPLSFIWGFKDPFNERMQGDFDYKLGNERLKAFIDHTFRKSNIFSYSKEAESNVRRRIMKELCFLNASISKKKAKECIEDQESDSGKSQESTIWDNEWFEKIDI